MVDLAKTHEAPSAQLFEELQDVQAVLLGIGDGKHPMVPMSPRVDAEKKQVFFFAKRSSHTVAEVGTGNQAQLALISKNGDYYAFVTGPIVQSQDRDAFDKHWSTVVSAWYPGGKEDPDVSLLQFTPNLANIWASTSSSAVFAWEIAKALTTGETPDVGVAVRIEV